MVYNKSMNVLVINGSPKGDYSITLQTVKYIERFNTEDKFEILNAANQISLLEKDFSECADKIKAADIILFAYPVFTFSIPAQLYRFIELMKQNFTNGELTGKFVTQVTTSKHFFDNTAHEFIRENCLDLQMKVINGLTADMNDLITKRGQREALDFWRYAKYQTKRYFDRRKKEDKKMLVYRVAIISDVVPQDIQLRKRIDEFKEKFTYQTDEINLQELKIDGGCFECLNCSTKGECIYKDGFQDILRRKVNSADAIVYAFKIQNHGMGSKFKYYFDRQYCNGHRTLIIDKPVGYIIEGDISRENNLMNIIHGRASVCHNILTHIAQEGNEDIEQLIYKLTFCLEKKIVTPQDFYGIAGMKIFRDLIYVNGGLMKADYNFYKKEGYFDSFATNQHGLRLKMRLVGLLFKNKKLKKKMGNKFVEKMINPYQKVINKKN